ncbi:MAG: HD domain-containing phosphohydrolase, partial [Candidatus Woesearchaeota archaeon]
VFLRYISHLNLQEKKKQYDFITSNMKDVIWMTDSNFNLTFVNDAIKELTGFSSNKYKKINIYQKFATKSVKTLKNIFKNSKQIFEKKSELRNIELNYIKKNSTKGWISTNILPIRDKDNGVVGFLGLARDITDIKKREEKYKKMARIDHLTKLYNKRYFNLKLQEYERKKVIPTSIITCDIDDLKVINDSYGHHKGDSIILSIANLLKEVINKRGKVISRTGGDEFSMLIPNANERNAQSLVGEIKNKLKSLNSSLDVDVNISLGVATKTNIKESLVSKIREADTNMYKDKYLNKYMSRNEILEAILNKLNTEYELEEGHSSRVADLVEKMAKELNLPDNDVEEIRLAGKFHDIGKVIIPSTVMQKNSNLTDSEYSIVKKHCEAGFQLLNSLEGYSNISKYILYHHERWDGKGYPKGLKKLNIPIGARIISVADAYDAMTEQRIYKNRMTKEQAINELKENSGKQFDEKIVRLFLDIID